MRFPSIRLVEQTQQKFRQTRDYRKERKRVTAIVGLFYYINAPT